MKKIGLLLSAFFVLFLIFSTSAMAVPVQWAVGEGGNGNYYDFVSATEISWTSANSDANSQSYNGMSGHLITITSQAEQDFFWNIFINEYQIKPSSTVWLGGYEPNNDGEWVWVTGESWDYTNWYNGEPNNQGGNENYLTLHGSPMDGSWNDQDDAEWGDLVGYFVEYESSAAPVPEPATIFLLGTGIVCIAGAARKKFIK